MGSFFTYKTFCSAIKKQVIFKNNLEIPVNILRANTRRMAIESLQETINRLVNGTIIGFSHDGKTLRLEIEIPVASYILPDSQYINLVLQNCPSVSYLSYTQPVAGRNELRDLTQIFSKSLVIQGVEGRLNYYYLIYCNSALNKLEAGELHLRTSAFQLYDQEFGRVDIPTFLKIADKLGSL